MTEIQLHEKKFVPNGKLEMNAIIQSFVSKNMNYRQYHREGLKYTANINLRLQLKQTHKMKKPLK